MACKHVVLILGLLAMIVLISSKVAANNFLETSSNSKAAIKDDKNKDQGVDCPSGSTDCFGGGWPGGGWPGSGMPGGGMPGGGMPGGGFGGMPGGGMGGGYGGIPGGGMPGGGGPRSLNI